MRRAQSVLDLLEEAARFPRACFPEGDDADFIVGLGVCDGDWHTRQRPQGHEALFSVREAVILVGEGQALEDARIVDEVEAVFLEVDGTLALGPGETHVQVQLRAAGWPRACFLRPTPEISCAPLGASAALICWASSIIGRFPI